MKNKEIQELEKEIEEQTKNLIGWEGKIVIKIKGTKFNVLENHSKFVEITKLDRNKVKFQVHKSYQEKIKKLKEIIGKNALKRNWDYTKAIDKIMGGEE